MKIKKSTLKTLAIYIFIIILSLFPLFFLSQKKSSENTSTTNTVTITGDSQIIDLTAKAGYSPRVITAEANKETILRVSTKNTFDCSSALTIPALKISKNLPATGTTDIPLGKQEAGKEIDGTCSMGMYSFTIKFI